jgi:hypothetical protein
MSAFSRICYRLIIPSPFTGWYLSVDGIHFSTSVEEFQSHIRKFFSAVILLILPVDDARCPDGRPKTCAAWSGKWCMTETIAYFRK